MPEYDRWGTWFCSQKFKLVDCSPYSKSWAEILLVAAAAMRGLEEHHAGDNSIVETVHAGSTDHNGEHMTEMIREEGYMEIYELVALMIVILLIACTILFEHLKEELLEHVATKRFEKVVHALFGEMTVLGFLSLCVFCLSQAGALTHLSLRIFDEPEVFEEMFELIHFGFFFIMIVYVFNVTVLIAKAKRIESQWAEFENMCHEPTSVQKALDNVRKHQRVMLFRCAFPNIGETDQFVTYLALREEFYLERSLEYPFAPKPVDKRLEKSFDYAAYLSKCLEERLGKTGEISMETWLFFACLAVLFCTCDVLLHDNKFVLSCIWISMAMGIFIFNCFFHYHLFQLEKAFCAETPDSSSYGTEDIIDGERRLPEHRLPKWCKLSLDEPSTGQKRKSRKYKQQRLFWFHKRGPKAYLVILQVNMVFFAIYWAVLITKHFPYLKEGKEDVQSIAQLLIAIVPAILCTKQWTSLVASVAHVSSIGHLRKPSIVAKVLRGQKVEAMIRGFLMLQRVIHAVEAVHNHKHQPVVTTCMGGMKTKGRSAAPHRIKMTFDALDESGDGSLHPDDLQRLMERFGMPVTEEMTRKIFEVLDADCDGVIGKSEFLMFYDEYVVGDTESMSVKQVAKALFDIFDSDSNGDISVLEFKDKLEAFNLGFSLGDVAELVRELDPEGEHVITLRKFETLVKKYHPKEIGFSPRGGKTHHQ